MIFWADIEATFYTRKMISTEFVKNRRSEQTGKLLSSANKQLPQSNISAVSCDTNNGHL